MARRRKKVSKKQHNTALTLTLNLCLVHYKVLLIATALELLPWAAVKAHVLILQLVKGEVFCRETTVTLVSC